MCIICVEYELGKLTRIEAVRNLNELGPWDEHQIELAKRLLDEKYEFRALEATPTPSGNFSKNTERGG